MKTKLNRVYIRFELWEELKYNMYGDSLDKKNDIRRAVEFTSNHKLYGSYMKMVIMTFKNSCINSLTDYSINRKAWLGHTAVALALNIPEHITREAWKHLTNEQQFLANKEAEYFIKTWEHNYRKDSEIYSDMENQMLL